MVIRLLGVSRDEVINKEEKFFVFSFDEDDFVIAKGKEEMKKYLLENRIDPDDIEDDDEFNPESDQDVLYHSPNWDYEENVSYDRLLEMLGGLEEVMEGLVYGLKEPAL